MLYTSNRIGGSNPPLSAQRVMGEHRPRPLLADDNLIDGL